MNSYPRLEGLAPMDPNLRTTDDIEKFAHGFGLPDGAVEAHENGPDGFRYVDLDLSQLNNLVPPNWTHFDRLGVAHVRTRDYPRTPGLTREAEDITSIHRGRVVAEDVMASLPGLNRLYRRNYLWLAQYCWDGSAVPASNPLYGVVLNYQKGTEMRFENHVDSNPLTGLLFCNEVNAPGRSDGGGELVIANRRDASSIEEVNADCTLIVPRAGHLIFFDAREFPHYARPLTHPDSTRVVAVMNYYTDACPEAYSQELLKHKHEIYGQSQ